MKKIVLMFFAAVTLLLTVSSCANKVDYNVTEIGRYKVEKSETPTNHVRIVMENGDAILIELYPEYAPITVQNFQSLVSEKFYDGIDFHRVIEGFVIQAGDPNGDGFDDGTHSKIVGEFTANGYDNPLSDQHERGVISMARAGNNPNSASTQFFIVHKATYSSSLNGNYAAFGRVIAGMDIVDKIASVETDSSDRPTKDQTIAQIRFVNIVTESE